MDAARSLFELRLKVGEILSLQMHNLVLNPLQCASMSNLSWSCWPPAA